MSPAVEALLWLSIPVISTVSAWFYLRRRSRMNVNAQIGIVETDLQRMRRQLRDRGIGRAE